MSDDTPRLKLGQLVDGQELDALAINDAFIQLDAFTDICLKDKFVNTPPATPADGDTYLLGDAPTGAWSSYAYKIAYCIDGGWRFYTPFDGMRAVLLTSGGFIYYHAGVWSDFAPPPSGAEASVASASVCDIGSLGSLCVAITGTAVIASFGTAPNALRVVRFAASLTLTHNAASLILPGAANIVTAAGDTGLFMSDSGGNWRCMMYQRATTGTGKAVLSDSPAITTSLNLNGWLVAGSLQSASPAFHVFSNASTTETDTIALFDQSNGSGAAQVLRIFAVGSGVGTAASNPAAVTVARAAGNLRSINAFGTVNVSGADYAEYETKADGCATVAKGQIIGFDTDGKITDAWANAISFGVKSTAPNLVGGDIWAADLTPPEQPAASATADELAAYKTALATFNTALETARQKVDRVSYSGKVPVNITGAHVGDYIIAVQSGTGIAGQAVATPTFDQYRNAVGRVRSILTDGRAEIAVIVH